jgi:hypothetical protein
MAGLQAFCQQFGSILSVTRLEILSAKRGARKRPTKILVALVIVRSGEHRSVDGQPLRAFDTVPAGAIFVPIRWIGAAEPVHRVLGKRETQIVGEDLDYENDHVDVMEEAEVDVGTLKVTDSSWPGNFIRTFATSFRRKTRIGDSLAPPSARLLASP